MRVRIKNTLFWGEVTGSAGSAENPKLEVTMNDGTKVYYKESDLTVKSIKEVVEDFMWSIFAENGNRKNQSIFFGGILILGIIIGAIVS